MLKKLEVEPSVKVFRRAVAIAVLGLLAGTLAVAVVITARAAWEEVSLTTTQQGADVTGRR